MIPPTPQGAFDLRPPRPSGAAWRSGRWTGDDDLDEWGAGIPPGAPRTVNGRHRAASHPGPGSCPNRALSRPHSRGSCASVASSQPALADPSARASRSKPWPGSDRTAAVLPATAASRQSTRVRVPPRNYSVATPPGYRRKLTSPLFGKLPVAIAFVNEKIHKILRLLTSSTTSPCGSDLDHWVAGPTQSRVSEHESDGLQTVFSAGPDRARSQPVQTVRNRRTTSSSSSPIAPQATDRPSSRLWRRALTCRLSGSFCSTSRAVKPWS